MSEKKTAKRRITINKGGVDRLKAEARTYIAWDRQIPSFGVKVQPTGRKSFILRYRPGGTGKQREITMGRYGQITPDKARRRALELSGDTTKGEDPLAARRAQERAQDALTLFQAIDLYDKVKLRRLRTGDKIKRTLQRDLVPLAKVPVAEITRADLTRRLDDKAADTPTAAQHLLECAAPLFKWLAEREHIEASPLSGVSRVHKRESRDRVLSDHEICAIWKASDETGPLWGPFFRLAMLLAQRRAEVAGMKWSEIDLDTTTWAIPGARTKTGRPHVVHLSRPALAILTDLAKRRGEGDFVFTNTGTTPISGFSKAKARLDKIGGVSAWRLHDYRRTFVSHAADMGIDAIVADRVLNHSAAATMSVVQRVYQRSEMLDQRRHALEAWGARVLEIAEGWKDTTKVVPLVAAK